MRNAVEGISRGISADSDGESCELRIENKHEQRSEITDVQRRQRYRVYVGKFLRVARFCSSDFLFTIFPSYLPSVVKFWITKRGKWWEFSEIFKHLS